MYLGSLKNIKGDDLLSFCIDYNKDLGRISETVNFVHGHHGRIISYAVTERRFQLNVFAAEQIEKTMHKALEHSRTDYYKWCKRKTRSKY